MKIQKFEDIVAWQRAQDLAVNIYLQFKNSRDWDFRNQICRAVVSISNNIAEGFNRNSDIEFRRFLFIAVASCSEVKSMLYLAERLEYLSQVRMSFLLEQAEEISKMIKSFIKYLDKPSPGS